ncbi:MAG: glycosyltransferase family 9 protein [Sphingobacteriales bacterium]|nr:MAG: glycosyltransferase family 9 protein [Sphingobacteriales bacterium]
MAIPRHIIVLRFSALGDIAMTVPVIKNLLQQNPSIEITFVSVPFVKPLFEGIERLNFFSADIKKEYKGILGLWKLSRKIKQQNSFDAVADLHNVLRTKLLRFFLGQKTSIIDKGREEKKELTRPVDKKLRPLKTGFQRYAEVFEKLGLMVHLNIEKGYSNLLADESLLPFKRENNIVIGIAPFAKHNAKIYPAEKMLQAVKLLAKNDHVKLLIFASKAELPMIESWKNEAGNIFIMAGKLNLQQELNLISQLDVMLSMDSANMHLASLYSIPVVSIWGGTHPFLGFYGWGQVYENILQTDLPCRPSSVFGNKDCPVHGAAGCMQQITPAMVAEKLLEVAGRK